MTSKHNNLAPRCPKCNERMKSVEAPPRFAQFLPSHMFNCDRCRIGLTYDDGDHDEADEAHTVTRV
jgi:hypothetical protein